MSVELSPLCDPDPSLLDTPYQQPPAARRPTESGQAVAQTDEFHWKYVKNAFSDWQVYVAGVMNIGIGAPLYEIALFLPTIILELGYTSSTAQLLTVPIYVSASISSVTVAYFSDKTGRRFPFVFGSLLAVLVGFIMTVVASSNGKLPGLVYAGVFVAACGCYPAFPANVSWLSGNLAGSYKRGAGMAIHIGIGNMGGGELSCLDLTVLINRPDQFV